ncbi:hypothetical protein JTB14_002435 [Gonioctena quinquepunctata]|nr:hypothetical protein JTB14_002435 [Gonioctena quinquepunctata]
MYTKASYSKGFQKKGPICYNCEAKIKIANNSDLNIVSKGTATINVVVEDGQKLISANEGMYAPDAAVNLLSISEIVRNGYKVIFDNTGAKIIDSMNKTVATGSETNGIYQLETEPIEIRKWLEGPKFLKLPEETWPRKPEECSEESIENILTVFKHGRDLELPKIDRSPEWIRLIRSTAWVLHFKEVSRIPKNNRPREVKLDVDTFEEASKLWQKKSQGESSEEISLFNQNKTLPKSSSFSKLSAFLDETGIIRSGVDFLRVNH